MITLEKLRIYEKYGGDMDHLARMQNEADQKSISNEDWAQIDDLIQDIGLRKRKLASQSYLESLDRRLKAETENQETIEELKRLTEKYYRTS